MNIYLERVLYHVLESLLSRYDSYRKSTKNMRLNSKIMNQFYCIEIRL